MKAYYNKNKFYNYLEEWMGAVLLAVMIVMLFVQAAMRYIFKVSVVWISEYSFYMFMYFVFLACSEALLRNDHIQIMAVIDKLPGKVKEAAHLLLYVVDSLLVAAVGYHIFLRVIDQFQMKTVSTTQFPLWIISTSLFVGMGASAIRCLMNIYLIIRYESISGREGE